MPLSSCPECHYNLKGLPADHACPECGFAYRATDELYERHRIRGLRLVAILFAVGAIESVVKLLFYPTAPRTDYYWPKDVLTARILLLGMIIGSSIFAVLFWRMQRPKPYLLIRDDGVCWDAMNKRQIHWALIVDIRIETEPVSYVDTDKKIDPCILIVTVTHEHIVPGIFYDSDSIEVVLAKMRTRWLAATSSSKEA